MNNPFQDQRTFMQAGDQTVDQHNPRQFDLYVRLIDEEREELEAGILADDRVEQLDALLDLLVVTIGALHSLGVTDVQAAWDEVIRSNMSKVDPTTGKIIKRADGKVLKPDTFSPPALEGFFQ